MQFEEKMSTRKFNVDVKSFAQRDETFKESPDVRWNKATEDLRERLPSKVSKE